MFKSTKGNWINKRFHVMWSCNKLNDLLALCDIWYPLSLDVSGINAQWILFWGKSVLGGQCILLRVLGKSCESWAGPPIAPPTHHGYSTDHNTDLIDLTNHQIENESNVMNLILKTSHSNIYNYSITTLFALWPRYWVYLIKIQFKYRSVSSDEISSHF